MNKKHLILGGIFLLTLGYGSGYYTKPTKVKTEIKEVIKTEIQKEESKAKTVYKERIVYKDGTIKEIERSDEKSESKEHSKTEIAKESKTEVKNDIGLNVSVLAITDGIKSPDTFGAHVTLRVISNFTVGVMGAVGPKHKLGAVSLGLSF
jgi:hypothetical protein